MEHQFKGKVVEVTSKEEGFEDSWFVATILRQSKKKTTKFMVQYHNLLDENGKNPLKESVHVSDIRPPQPKGPRRLFRINEQVDAFHNDGWWKGVISKINDDSRYCVYFKASKEEMNFSQCDLRPHMEWIEGKWVDSSPNQEASVVAQDKGTARSPNLTSSPDHGTEVATQLTTGQKNMKQSTSKSDNEFLRPFKKSSEVAATEELMSTKVCQGNETAIVSPNELDEQSVLSILTTKRKRSNLKNRRARNSLFPGLFSSNSCESSIKNGHVPSYTCEDVIEVENSDIVGLPNPNVLCRKEQHVILSAQYTEDPSVGTAIGQEGVECIDNQTENFAKRKRGRPKCSAKKHKTGKSISWDLSMPVRSKDPEKESTSNKWNNVQSECTQMRRSFIEDHETPPFLEKAGTSVMKDIEGTEDRADDNHLGVMHVDCTQFLSPTVHQNQNLSLCLEKSNSRINGNDLECTEYEAANNSQMTIERDCTQSLGPTVEHQTHSLFLEKSELHMKNCTEDEAANDDMTIAEIDRTQLLRPTLEEHQTHSLCHEKTNLQIGEDKGDIHLMPSEAIFLRDTSLKSLKHPESTNEAESSLVLEANGDEGPLKSSADVVTNTYSSPMPRDVGPLLLVKESLPFVKRSHMWESIESMEVFKLIPQHPHFRPLEKENEEFREGNAMGYMLNFAHLMDRICKAQFDDTRDMFENKLKALNDLEELGFTVQPLRSRLEHMLKIKDNYFQLDDKWKTTETEAIDKKRQLDEIQESVTRLNKQLQALMTERETKGVEVAELQKMADETKEKIQRAKLDFDIVVAAPW